MRARSASLALASCIAMVACAPGGLDRGGMIADTATTYGVAVPVATCMVDELIAAFGEDQLAQDRNPHPGEVDVLEGAQDRCTLRESTIEQIMASTGDHDIAACIFDRAAEAFGFDAVTSGAATPGDDDALAAIAQACERDSR